MYVETNDRVTLTYNANGGSGAPSAESWAPNATNHLSSTEPTRTGCEFLGWNEQENGSGATTYDANDVYTMPLSSTTLYAQWGNFVIYRTGDKEEDAHAPSSAVETFDGGTIDQVIEYRMKVEAEDQWYSLCLPFDVNAVKVWEDDSYYDIQPYYRKDGNFYLGHYVIRTPKDSIGLKISEFGQWNDPTTYEFTPQKNTPYIILWHDYTGYKYFEGKYIAFFGASGQTIPTSMRVGAAPKDDDKVNIYPNNSMVSGVVQDGYTFVSDYGNGAWLRNDETGTNRTVLPFECYIRANAATTPKFAALRPRAAFDDVTTGWDDVINSERQERIMVYTVTGYLVAQFENCSVNEAAQRLSAAHHEGLFILRSNNECVKLMLNSK